MINQRFSNIIWKSQSSYIIFHRILRYNGIICYYCKVTQFCVCVSLSIPDSAKVNRSYYYSLSHTVPSTAVFMQTAARIASFLRSSA